MSDLKETVLDMIDRLRHERRPFAVATVVRTVAATAAKAGAKAVVLEDGTMHGWIGGGCAQGAVARAVKSALADGQPRLISVQPHEIMSAEGVAQGEARGGVEYYRSHCPSKGTVDVFIEPMRPRPVVLVCGTAPVARAVADLAPRFGFEVVLAAPEKDWASVETADRRIDGYEASALPQGDVFAIVATQGRGDIKALTGVLASDMAHVAFVGSRKKAQALKRDLADAGVPEARLASLHAPAGLDIGAITPEEIALSIMAEVIQVRRAATRRSGANSQTSAA
ncbi:XdhC/CoxI family protein [Breoghania sp. L-A4]|uniref:XdhC family protein n=1 Tax=Breoghania sp. L-A4 TaxID=2304600 RepID=UPI000E35D1BE|nr:XdhC/CoxI family protein [Breoghania sp. L-A4]AXS40038.1 XdhC /CoxI family-like protein [Breoghania sp. L-A4]